MGRKLLKTVQTITTFRNTLADPSLKTAAILSTVNYLFKTAIGIYVISNHNSFRVLVDKNCFRNMYTYIHTNLYSAKNRENESEKIYIYILALEMASRGKQHCANCIGTLSFPTG